MEHRRMVYRAGHAERQMAFSLARRLGMPVVHDFRVKDPVWDGQILRIQPTGEPVILHEIAHMIVAKQHGEAGMTNWGLEIHEKDWIGTENSDAREREVAPIETALEALVGAAVEELADLWEKTSK